MITPLSDTDFFTAQDLAAAGAHAQRDPGTLTNRELAMIATYDAHAAEVAAAARMTALVEREAVRAKEWREATTENGAAGADMPTGVTALELAAILEAVRDTVDTRISDRLARDLGPRLRALEQRDASVKNTEVSTTTANSTHASNLKAASAAIDAAILRLAPQIAAVIAARFEVEETALLARGGTLADYDALREDFAGAEAEAYAQLRILLEHAAAATVRVRRYAAGTA